MPNSEIALAEFTLCAILLCVASVNTSSVREENARVEQEVAWLSEAGKVLHESWMLFNTLLMIVNMLVAIFIQRSTRKNGKNSSTPPSQTTEDQNSTTLVTNMKGPTQNDASFDNSRTVETETVARVSSCSICDENLSQVSVRFRSTYQNQWGRPGFVFKKRVAAV